MPCNSEWVKNEYTEVRGQALCSSLQLHDTPTLKALRRKELGCGTHLVATGGVEMGLEAREGCTNRDIEL